MTNFNLSNRAKPVFISLVANASANELPSVSILGAPGAGKATTAEGKN